MPRVATILTLATPGEALGAIVAALPASSPRVAAEMIAAQSAVETAGWKAMHNFNVGNVTPTAAQAASGPWMDQGLPMRYRSFSSLLDGARAMVGWVQAHGGLLDAANAGDLDAYVSGLERGCYLGCVGNTDPTGHTVTQTDYDGYRAGIASWMARLAHVSPVPPSSTWLPGVPNWLFASAAAVVGVLALRARGL